MNLERLLPEPEVLTPLLYFCIFWLSHCCQSMAAKLLKVFELALPALDGPYGTFHPFVGQSSVLFGRMLFYCLHCPWISDLQSKCSWRPELWAGPGTRWELGENVLTWIGKCLSPSLPSRNLMSIDETSAYITGPSPVLWAQEQLSGPKPIFSDVEI